MERERTMMQKMLKKIVVLCTIQMVGVIIATSEIRSPNFFDSWYVHYPFDVVTDDACECEGSFHWNSITGFWAMTADEAFRSQCCDKPDVCPPCPPTSSMPSFSHVTTHKEPLSALIFGKSCFLGKDAFASDATLCSSSLFLSQLSPRVKYTEYGVMVGVHGFKTFGCNDRGRFGFRIQIPIKVVDVDLLNSGDFETVIPGAADQVRYSFADANVSNTFRLFLANAYRFDLLNTLLAPDGQPLMKYTATNVFVSGQQIDVVNPIDATSHVLKKTNGKIDVEVDTIYVESGLVSTPLPTNGVIPNNDRRYLARNFDYSPIKADPTLFLVPSSGQQTAGLDESLLVQNIIDQAIQNAAASNGGGNSGEQFFRNCCINFESQRAVGVGDLEFDVYGGYHTDDWYADLMLNSRFPSGKKICDPRHVFSQPTGNNGHVEFGPGVEGGWQGCWFAVTAGVAYSHVFSAQEKRAAPFTGATVINIGPIVDADISWGYVTAHVDLTFLHPRNKNLGGTFGYELYAKQKDKVKLCKKTAVDCCANTSTLNSCLLENNTNTQTHKLRGTVFHRMRCWELFAGASLIVAGRNAMREAEWLLGINVYF